MTAEFAARADLEKLLNQEETDTLEFKSSAPLHPAAERTKFLNDLSCDVSAMLNSGGGTIVIGIEEVGARGSKIAAALSSGVPGAAFTAIQFENAICDRIKPSVADLVHVRRIVVGDGDPDKLFAFVITVREGNTAYQAHDKRYYARRSNSSVAMDDKDIRLRMLNNQRPRLMCSVSARILKPYIAEYSRGDRLRLLQVAGEFVLRLTNDGLFPINEVLVKTRVSTSTGETLDDLMMRWMSTDWPERKILEIGYDGHPLFPGDYYEWSFGHFDCERRLMAHLPEITGHIQVLLKDGLPWEGTVDASGAVNVVASEIDKLAAYATQSTK